MSHPEVQSMRVVDRRGQYFRDFTPNRRGYELKFTRFTSYRQRVFDKKRKKLNSRCDRQKLANSELEKCMGNHGPQPDATKT